MDLATRRDFYLRLWSDVRRERTRLRRLEITIQAAVDADAYPNPEHLAALHEEVRQARQRREDLVEEILLVVTAPRPPFWIRVWESLTRRV